MPRLVRLTAVAVILTAAFVASQRSADAQVYTTYYAPAVPVTTYYAPRVTTYYAPAVTNVYSPVVAAPTYVARPVYVAPAITTVRVRRPLLRPWATVVRQRTVPVAPVYVAPTTSYYLPY